MTIEYSPKKQLLRTTHPAGYEQLLEELSTHNIHAFDVQATSSETENEVEVTVRFGEAFNQALTKVFSKGTVLEKNEAFTDFCKEVGDTCKETLIADYFKMVKP